MSQWWWYYGDGRETKSKSKWSGAKSGRISKSCEKGESSWSNRGDIEIKELGEY